VLPSKHQPERHVWKRIEGKLSVKYVVDRTHPVLSSLLAAGCGHDHLLETVIRMIETSVPIAAMLQEPAKALDSVPESAITDIDELLRLFIYTESFLIRNGKTPEEARKRVLLSEPFAENRDVLEGKLGIASSNVARPEAS